MVRKRNLAKFESSNISKTGGAMPTKPGVHALDINLYLYNELILFDSIFDTHWYSPWSEREIWPNLKANFISKTGDAASTKIGVHAFDTNLYLHENLEPILFVSIFWTPWTEREVNLL